ncbi:hypothetical protein N2152v2_007540 [Parachlorella kessleri]
MSSVSGTDSQGSDLPEQEEQWDDWEDEESSGVRCLLSTAVFPTVAAALAHDKQDGFDLRKYITQEHLGQYDVIKLINYFRSEVQAGRNPSAAVLAGGRAWDAEQYFQSVLPDDELLFHDWEEELDGMAGTGPQSAAQQQEEAIASSSGSLSLGRLRQENEALRSALEAMQAVMLQDEGGSGLAEILGQQQQQQQQAKGGQLHGGDIAPVPLSKPGIAGSEQAQRIDKSYFESYSFFDIHREMLADKVRTDAYQAALEGNPALLRGATVLDVGCGTAILSMFAARAGAAAVVGVDGSEEIAKYARSNCIANGLSSEAGQGGPVSIVTGRVEALTALPLPAAAGGKVDVLVSEWMGYALLFESMLDSVLHARDRFLKPGGAVLPDLAHIYVAAGGKSSTGLDFWESVYGFSMAPIQESIRQSALQRAVVRPVSGDQLVSPPVLLKGLDLATMAAADQDFTADFRLEAQPGAGPQQCHSLVVWFDTVFSERFCQERPVTLCTGPGGPQTHWVQMVLLLRETIELVSLAEPAADSSGTNMKTVLAIQGRISFARNKVRHRSLDIAVQYYPVHVDGSQGSEQAAIYSMGVSDD